MRHLSPSKSSSLPRGGILFFLTISAFIMKSYCGIILQMHFRNFKLRTLSEHFYYKYFWDHNRELRGPFNVICIIDTTPVTNWPYMDQPPSLFSYFMSVSSILCLYCVCLKNKKQHPSFSRIGMNEVLFIAELLEWYWGHGYLRG